MHCELQRLNALKETCKSSYLSNLEYLEERLNRINVQLERTPSELKREILEKQRGVYEKDIELLDTTIERAIAEIDAQIETHKSNDSLEYNMKKLREGIQTRNVNAIFGMFENVANVLDKLAQQK